MTNKSDNEFRQVAHSGGHIILNVTTHTSGQRLVQNTYQHNRPVASAIFAVHVIPPGLPVATAELGGIGSPMDPGPAPGHTVMAYVVSDSEGMWGAECPRCSAYWRSGSPSKYCVRCGLSAQPHIFLTQAQRAYLSQYCEVYIQAISSEDGEHDINFDAVADAVNSIEKPPFYYAEESQQNKFKCDDCGCTVDILGKFGYCSGCGTRNDIQELDKTLESIRARINSGEAREGCVRDAVSAFDSTVRQHVEQLANRVPMTEARVNRLENMLFHNVNLVRDELRNTFDIDIFRGIDETDQRFAVRMFLRRHVYEHNGGEADEAYLEQSGDTSVRLKQSLHETQESAHDTVSIVMRMAKNLHDGFHNLFPFDEKRIRRHKRP
jgi:hypothetical protein